MTIASPESTIKISIGISCSSRWVEWGGLPLEWDRMRRLRWPETGWRHSSIHRRSHHLVRSQSPYYQPAHSRRWKFLSKDCKQKLYNGNFLWEGSQKNLSCRLLLWHCNQQMNQTNLFSKCQSSQFVLLLCLGFFHLWFPPPAPSPPPPPPASSCQHLTNRPLLLSKVILDRPKLLTDSLFQTSIFWYCGKQ